MFWPGTVLASVTNLCFYREFRHQFVIVSQCHIYKDVLTLSKGHDDRCYLV